MKLKANHSGRILSVFALFVLAILVFNAPIAAASLSPSLQKKLFTAQDNLNVGTVLVAFQTTNGLQADHLNILRSVGVTGGKTFPALGIVAAALTAGQIRALNNNPSVRSIWSNDRIYLYLNQARVLTGVDRLRVDADFTKKNGGMPVSGAGDFSVMVIDSGIDATHADLAFGTKVVQNVQTISGTDTVDGFTPNLVIENVPNTDQSVGHGTHCAGIIGGNGSRSGSTYAGVAPGVKLIGAGLGAGLFVLNAVSAWEWALTNQFRYNIRVISNSYGASSEFNPDNPINIASKAAYERNITVVFAGANAGPAKGTWNTYAKAPWVIGVAAGTKEGELADFSSRGIPREERLNDDNPLNDYAAPTITAPGTGRAFETNSAKFTKAIVSTRAASNLTANGTTDDADLPVSAIPFYTQISGTSMATPFVAGSIALMLDADPTLSPDEIKQIIQDTATAMPGRAEWEVGAGYINVYAAVDKVFNRAKKYKNFQEVTFNAHFDEERARQQDFHINYDPTGMPGANSPNSQNFTVAAGQNLLDIFATVSDSLGVDEGNPIGLIAYSPDGKTYSSGIELPVIGANVREISVPNPVAGQWRLEVRGIRSLNLAAAGTSTPAVPTSGIALTGAVDGAINQIKYILPVIQDIQNVPNQSDIESALKNRLIDTFADGSFKPNSPVTRMDLANTLMLDTPVRQSLGAGAKFSDVSGDAARIAEAVTAKGSTLRDYDFTPTGMLSFSGSTFNSSAAVTRLDLAVAFVKALGHDTEARALANFNVTYQGTTISDNAQIPAALRGYVQIAINDGLFETYAAEVRQTAPGQFTVFPGPRFEPNTNVSRAALAVKLNSFRTLFTTGG